MNETSIEINFRLFLTLHHPQLASFFMLTESKFTNLVKNSIQNSVMSGELI